MELYQKEPVIIVDGAHTVEAMNSLKQSIQTLFPNKRIVIIFGILQDKKIKEILHIVSSFADILIFTKSTSSRAMEPFKLEQFLGKTFDNQYFTTQSVKEGIEKALKLVKKTDVILITGSLTVVADAQPSLTLLKSSK
jgi:dihydrofolate synthase/folylpolyglutamate synthase